MDRIELNAFARLLRGELKGGLFLSAWRNAEAPSQREFGKVACPSDAGSNPAALTNLVAP